MTDAALEDLPPSPSYVYYVLQREGPLTQPEIAEETTLPKRTVRWALERLQDEDLVEAHLTGDARQRRYGPT